MARGRGYQGRDHTIQTRRAVALPVDQGCGGMSLKQTPEFKTALAQASAEHGLADYYLPSVRPLFSMPSSQWPRCCGSTCEPCAQTLIAVATRTCEILGVSVESLPIRSRETTAE